MCLAMMDMHVTINGGRVQSAQERGLMGLLAQFDRSK